MEPAEAVSVLGEDCLLPQSRSDLGCFIETKDDTTPSDSEPCHREFDTCPIVDIGMQCMSSGETGGFEEPLLSDQLLSFPLPKPISADKKAGDRTTDSDTDDPATKNLFEGLLLDKCTGEEVLLANTTQDWGYIESFISESKMELLDLCSKNDLSVNLFSEEDVDNYMFDDDDDDSTLSSDVCSLKIRYESFQDNMREKTNVLQEETQFNFFPSVVVNCPKKEDGTARRGTKELPHRPGEEEEEEDLGLSDEGEGKTERCNSPGEGCSPDYSPKIDYFMDSSNSAEDSGDYSDDSSCTGSSVEAFPDGKPKRQLSRKGGGSSNHLNYGLRAKRKVRYSEDYLYDVDSIESERNAEKRDKQVAGQKEERDDDWCPKKRRKSSRKEPPVIIKYIIINRFKGEKHMSVKLFKMDPTVTTVSLDTEAMSKYEKLAPLKLFWQEQQREREEQLKLTLRDKPNFHPNGRHRPFSSSPPKRKYKFANRFRIQRIQTVEQSPTRQGSSASASEECTGTKDGTVPAGSPLPLLAPGRTGALDAGDITHAATPKSRSQQREEKRIGNKIVRIRKFKSEARLRSKKLQGTAQADEESVTSSAPPPQQASDSSSSTGLEGAESTSVQAPHRLVESQSVDAGETFAFTPDLCTPTPNNPTPPAEAEADDVPVIPGGYLQTLLDGSDSSSSASIAYFPQQTGQQYPALGLSVEEKQFASLQLAQSCVLSPPSESELQQSPQNCTNFTQMWHSQLCHNQQFAPEIPETPILPEDFAETLPVPVSAEDMAMPGYSQVNLEGDRVLYEKNYLPEQPMQPADGDFQTCQLPCVDGQLQFQRGTLNTDHGRLTSFDSMGSLSVASSSYSSMSMKSCEKEGGEEDTNGETFLAHCSPKVVIQQSVEALTPLRESTDLLDISNFTPDKFRHTSLSELSPPETPNLSPQVKGREMKIAGGKALDYQDVSDNMTWNCNMMEQADHVAAGAYTGDSHQFQMHVFNNTNGAGGGIGLDDKVTGAADFSAQAAEGVGCGAVKGTKSKKRNGGKQAAGEGGKKARAPKAAKADKGKVPRQNSRSSKKLKAHLEEKAGKGKAGASNQAAGDWPGMSWPDGNGHASVDDQREFEEPSNILSNIVSGMAEVQRFMMASIEPLWGPASSVCVTPDANSLKLKTLKILAGTTPDPKKKGAAGSGGTKGRKAGGKGAKNQAKFNPFFPQLALGCNMFEKPNLCIPGINGPAHKKMYRHKTSAKFPRVENIKGKRAEREREPSKDIELMASFEKLR
ncbi:neurite extension and migration factor [Clupea harengus]|uniref:Neurite extension and migration factor n=1 Tax=Clupea harengus TaxID=7950 RepID=A0A6P8GVM0_CLUHA|nr:neurite extension and migration factor [Clupea harengus]XP_031443244.1 neurite extension and migration factor [Clupea harengus]